jgi:hypothetical protein
VQFIATNALSGAGTTTITVTNVDRPPTVSAPASRSAREDMTLSFVVHARDLDGEAIASLGAENLPAGASFTPDPGDTTGTFSWTPAQGTPSGPYEVQFIAANALADTATTSITVTQADRAPVVAAPTEATVAEGAPLSFVVHAADPDGEAITSLAALGLPSGATFIPDAGDTTGSFMWTPGFGVAPGPYDVRFTASNALSGADTTTITVINVDRAPIVTAPATMTVSEGQQVVVNVSAVDPDGETIGSLEATGLPAGATFVPDGTNTSGMLTWNTTTADGRTAPYVVTFTATNALVGNAATSITVNESSANLVNNPSFELNLTGWNASGSATLSRVAGGHEGAWACRALVSGSGSFGLNDRPNIVGSVTAGVRYRYSAWVKLAAGAGQSRLRVREYTGSGENRATVYSAYMTLSATWQQLTLDYVAQQTGNYLDFQVLEGPGVSGAAFLIDDIAVLVVPAGTAPPIVTASATVNVNENQQLVLNVTASDPDGDPISSLVANLTGLPAGHGAQFVTNGANTAATLKWTPGFNDAPGPYSVTFTALNAQSGSATTSITVNNLDRAPQVVAPASVALVELTPVSFQVTASDPDGQPLDSLVADLSGLPPGHGATFIINGTNTSGAFAWTPEPGDGPGPYTVTFRARNALIGTATTSISANGGIANLANNPSFEVNLTGWNASGSATLSRVAGGHEGAWACQSLVSGSSSFGLNDSPNIVGSVTAGARYRFSAWVKLAAGAGQSRLRVREYTGSGENRATTYSVYMMLSATWQQLTLDYVAQQTGNYLDFQVLEGPGVSGAAFLIDDIVVQNITGPALAAKPAADDAVERRELVPAEKFGAWCAPNPVRGEAMLHLVTTRDGFAHARLFDVRGREIGIIFDHARLPAGRHAFALNTTLSNRARLPAGVYFYRVEAVEGTHNGRMVVIE